MIYWFIMFIFIDDIITFIDDII